jgi:hypothetical protein
MTDHDTPPRAAVWLSIGAVLGLLTIGASLTVAVVRALGGE